MKAVLNGLVLVGGKSSRMGHEKRLIQYHDQPQEVYLSELLSVYCSAVYLSCNVIQAAEIGLPKIIDEAQNGPMSGLLSGFRNDPKAAWLVVPCDLPNLNAATIATLLKNRNPAKLATVIINAKSKQIEPLLAIYEPAIFEILQEAHKKGAYSLMNMLQHIDYQPVLMADDFLKNINSEKEKTAWFTS